jgi:predicted nucleotidyltransferase
MAKPKIDIPADEIAAFCRRHHVRSLSLFGSVLREDFGPGSDADVLVEFEPGAQVGFITLSRCITPQSHEGSSVCAEMHKVLIPRSVIY